MMKKIMIISMFILIGATVLTGCNNEGREELVGTFSGVAGVMEFIKGGEVIVEFSEVDVSVWDLYPPAWNKKHQYQFLNDEDEVVPYEQATQLRLLDMEYLRCKIEKDRITIFPGPEEVVFEKVESR